MQPEKSQTLHVNERNWTGGHPCRPPPTHLGSTNVIVGPNYQELALFKVICVGTVRSDEVLIPSFERDDG